MKNSPYAGRSVPIPTNRELTVSLIGSLIRFAIDVPQVLRRRENLSPDKLFFLLLPIVRNLGKLIDRIRHSSSVVGRNASDGSARFEKSGGPELPHTSSVPSSLRRIPPQPRTGTVPISTIPTTNPSAMLWQTQTQQVTAPHNPQRQRQQQQPHPAHRCNLTPMLMSDEDDEESTVAFEMHRDSTVLPHGPPPGRQVLRQRDGNYAIRETTDTRSADGTFQRITKTISGPDVMILTNITNQLSELPTLLPRAPVDEPVARVEK